MTIAKVSAGYEPAVYTANGALTAFEFSFPIFATAHLVVSINDVTPPPIGYVVTGVGDEAGGTVTFTSPPADGATVTLERSTPILRDTSYANDKAFSARPVDAEFATLFMIAQELSEGGGGGGGGGSNGALPFITAATLGLHGDGETDDAYTLNEDMKTRGQAVYYLKADGDGFRLNSRINLKSGQKVHFASPLMLGKYGGVRIYGGFYETPLGSEFDEPLFRITAEIEAGADTIPIDLSNQSSATLSDHFSVGDTIIIRGQSDGSGSAIDREEAVVTAVDDGEAELTVAPDLEFGYLPTYPSGDYEENFGTVDRTFVTKKTTAVLGSNVAQGDIVLATDTAGSAAFDVGDYALLTDDSLASDVAGTSTNRTHVEVVEVVAVDTDADTITIATPAVRAYTTAKRARLEKLDVVTGAEVYWGDARFQEAPDASPASRIPTFEIGYAVDSYMVDCRVDNQDAYGSRGAAHRIYQSLNCGHVRPSVRNPKHLGSGDGYGISIYYSSRCFVRDGYAEGCRHGAVLQGSNHCTVSATLAGNLISDLDFHGLDEVANHADVVVVGAKRSDAATGSTTLTAVKFGNTTHLAGARANYVKATISNFVGDGNAPHARCVQFLPPSSGNIAEVDFSNVDRVLFCNDTNGFTSLTCLNNTLIARGRGVNQYAVRVDSSDNGSTNRIFDGLTLKLDIQDYDALDDTGGGVTIVQATRVTLLQGRMQDARDTEPALFFDDVTDLVVAGTLIENATGAISLTDCPSARVIVYGRDISGTLIDDVSGNTSATLLDGFTFGGTFIALSDTPSSYTGDALKFARVNAGETALEFVSANPSGISEVVEDTTPQLGGNLDVNGQSLVSVSSGNITLEPDGSGDVQLLTDDVLIEEDLIHVGDTDTKITFESGGDAIAVATGGSTRIHANNSGVQLGGANARVTTVLDQDDMSSDSATALATQQSIKAYVDARLLPDLGDSTPDSGNVLIGDGDSWESRAISGDLTINSTGGATIPNDTVSNAKMANMAQATVKMRAVGASTGDPIDGTATQLVAVIATADGAGSGLDADTVDGIEGAALLQKTQLAASTITPGTGTLDLTGTNGQILKVDGSGNVAFDDPGSVPVTLGDLSDVGDGTPTSGHLTVGDGDSWESVAMSGDATIAPGGAVTVANNAITNAKAQDMAQATFKLRADGAGTGDPTDGTADQASTILDAATDPFLRTSVIGSTVQAYDADLDIYAGITPSANVQSLLGSASYAAMRTLLDLYTTSEVDTLIGTLGLGSISDNSLLSYDGGGALTNPVPDEDSGLMVDDAGNVLTRLGSMIPVDSATVLFLTSVMEVSRGRSINVNVGSTVVDIVLPDDDVVAHRGAKWDIEQGADQSGSVYVNRAPATLGYDGPSTLTTVTDAVFGTPSGNTVPVTSAGGNLPAASADQRIYIAGNSNSENDGIWVESGGSPTTSAVTMTKISDLGGGLTAPVAQSAESVDIGLAAQLGDTATGAGGATGVVVSDDGVTLGLVRRNATAYVNDEALSLTAGFAAVVNGTITVGSGTINGGAYVELAGARASATLGVDRNAGSAPVARLEGETKEARTLYGALTVEGLLSGSGVTAGIEDVLQGFSGWSDDVTKSLRANLTWVTASSGGGLTATLDTNTSIVGGDAITGTHRILTSDSAITVTLDAQAAVGTEFGFTPAGAGAVSIAVESGAGYWVPSDDIGGSAATAGFTLSGYGYFVCIRNSDGDSAEWLFIGQSTLPSTFSGPVRVTEEDVASTYTVDGDDLGKILRYTGSGSTWTINVAGATGEVAVENDGSGAITVSAGTASLKGGSSVAVDKSAVLRYFNGGAECKVLVEA